MKGKYSRLLREQNYFDQIPDFKGPRKWYHLIYKFDDLQRASNFDHEHHLIRVKKPNNIQYMRYALVLMMVIMIFGSIIYKLTTEYYKIGFVESTYIVTLLSVIKSIQASSDLNFHYD